MRDDQIYAYHAYDYGWRRVRLGDQSGKSPADPTGKWFSADMANDAEAMFREHYRGSGPRIETAKDREAHEWREHFARERGFADFAALMKFGIRRAARIPPHSQETAPQLPASEIAP